jgi:cytochrome c
VSPERLTIWLVLAAALASAGAAARYFDVHLGDPGRAEAEALTGGNVENGRHAIGVYGCGTCHTIRGVRTARGLVGPSLEHFAERIYIAGTLPNTTGNLVVWIAHPTRVSPHTAMPETGITEAEARDVAAFLYSRR